MLLSPSTIAVAGCYLLKKFDGLELSVGFFMSRMVLVAM